MCQHMGRSMLCIRILPLSHTIAAPYTQALVEAICDRHTSHTTPIPPLRCTTVASIMLAGSILLDNSIITTRTPCGKLASMRVGLRRCVSFRKH